MRNNGINIAEWSVALSGQQMLYMAVMDSEARLTFVNSHFFRCFRKKGTPTQLPTFIDCLEEQDADRFRASLSAFPDEAFPLIIELRMKVLEGKWVKWQVSRLDNSSPAHEKFLCLGHEIANDDQLRKYDWIAGQNYRSIIEDLSVGIIFQDVRGGVIAANRKAAQILEMNLDALYHKKDITSLFKCSETANSTGPGGDPPFRKALLTGKHQTNVVVNMVSAGGNDRNILWNAQPLCVADQCEPSFVMSTLVDITKEKRLEKELETRDQLFTSFMDHTPYFSWIVNTEGDLLYANKPVLDYFHTDRSVIGDKITGLLSPALAGAFYEKIESVSKSSLTDHSIVRSAMADGSEHVFQLTVFPIHGVGELPVIGGEALDITEAYQAREEAKKATERLFYVSQASSEAIWDWNVSTGQIFCNQALELLIGSDLGSSLDLNWCFHCIHEDDRSKVEQIIREAMAGNKQSWEAEYRFLTVQGKMITVYNRGFILYEDGKPYRVVGSMKDITDVRKLETQLARQRITQQKNIAGIIMRAQQEERTRIGHELHDNVNQILTSANLYISVLDPSVETFSDVKQRAMEIISLAIEEIRKLSKGMVMPDFRENGLIGSIANIAEEIRYAKIFNVSFEYNDKRSIELLDINRKMTLFRIVQEQTKNIVKHAKAANMHISLYCCEDQVRLLISDDGKGFDPATTKWGLGLTNIVERAGLYGGKAMVNTSPGHGCTLIVNLPLSAQL